MNRKLIWFAAAIVVLLAILLSIMVPLPAGGDATVPRSGTTTAVRL
jgi:hypothetical protein